LLTRAVRQSIANYLAAQTEKENSMKLGFLTSKIDDITKAKQLGFDAVELGTGAFGRAEDRVLDNEKIERAAQLCKENDIEITALAAYSAAFSSPQENNVLPAYMLAFEAAEKLGVRVISSMSGFNSDKKWDANLQLWADRSGQSPKKPSVEECASLLKTG